MDPIPDLPMKETHVEQVNVRLDADIAAILKADAERVGVPLTGYLSDFLRRALKEAREPRPVYLPPGRDPAVVAAFKATAKENPKHVWVFRDIIQPVVWILPALLVDACDLFIVIRPDGGRPLSVPVDNLFAWPEYDKHHECMGHVYHWWHAGATPHPWCPPAYRPRD